MGDRIVVVAPPFVGPAPRLSNEDARASGYSNAAFSLSLAEMEEVGKSKDGLSAAWGLHKRALRMADAVIAFTGGESLKDPYFSMGEESFLRSLARYAQAEMDIQHWRRDN